MPPTPPIALRPVAVAEGIHQIPVLSDNIIWIWVRAGKAVVVDPAVGDPVIAWLEERDLDLDALDSNTIEDFYADLVGDVGFDTAAARGALDAQAQLLGQLEADREAVSGVNIDEEMVDLLKYQQSYEAAARFISVAQEMTDVLINLGR